jgi:hypothetical protein
VTDAEFLDGLEARVGTQAWPMVTELNVDERTRLNRLSGLRDGRFDADWCDVLTTELLIDISHARARMVAMVTRKLLK